jgi:hypothetical protein
MSPAQLVVPQLCPTIPREPGSTAAASQRPPTKAFLIQFSSIPTLLRGGTPLFDSASASYNGLLHRWPPLWRLMLCVVDSPIIAERGSAQLNTPRSIRIAFSIETQRPTIRLILQCRFLYDWRYNVGTWVDLHVLHSRNQP